MAGMDNFLIGDGSAKLMKHHRLERNFSEQLVGVFGERDLSKDNLKSHLDQDPIVESENDIEVFANKDVVFTEDFEKIFLICKKQVYDVFNFLSIKSEKMGDTPVKEEDLIVTKEDRDFISYMESYGPHDYFSVDKIARLLALREMGITEVMFLSVDDCPICLSYDHCIFNRDVIFFQLLREGFSHRYADFDIFPVVRREFYTGSLGKVLDIPRIEVSGVTFKNVPIEYKDDLDTISSKLGEGFSKEVEFTDIIRYCFLNSIEETPGMVVYEDDERIVIHNSYVGSLGPMDFLYNYIDVEKEETEKIDISLLEGDSYYIKGVECGEYEGSYWNKQTGEKVQ